MSWEQIYKDLDDFAPRMEWYVKRLERIHSFNNLKDKQGAIANIKPLHLIDVSRNTKYILNIDDNKINSQIYSSGNFHPEAFAEISFTQHDGIYFNFGEWIIINTQQLDQGINDNKF